MRVPQSGSAVIYRLGFTFQPQQIVRQTMKCPAELGNGAIPLVQRAQVAHKTDASCGKIGSAIVAENSCRQLPESFNQIDKRDFTFESFGLGFCDHRSNGGQLCEVQRNSQPGRDSGSRIWSALYNW